MPVIETGKNVQIFLSRVVHTKLYLTISSKAVQRAGYGRDITGPAGRCRMLAEGR